MQNAKNVVTVERERERATLLNKVAHISVELKFQKILYRINLKNKDPCYGLGLLHLRI